MQYLLRHAEIGRDGQSDRRKLQRDILALINARAPDARSTCSAGRIFLEVEQDVSDLLSELHGLSSFSPCERCSLDELERVVLARADSSLRGARTFAIRAKCSGVNAPSSQELAARLGRAVQAHHSELRVDLEAPQAFIGVDVRGADCYVFDEVVTGLDYRAAVLSPSHPELRFVADQMLGTLTVWLRLLGFDTIERPHAADSALSRAAREDGRILLTRDRPLARIQSVRVVLLTREDVESQLRELAEAVGLELRRERMFTRCVRCNGLLEVKTRAFASGRVPASVYAAYETFRYCSHCDQLYWPGHHHARILSTAERIFAR